MEQVNRNMGRGNTFQEGVNRLLENIDRITDTKKGMAAAGIAEGPVATAAGYGIYKAVDSIPGNII